MSKETKEADIDRNTSIISLLFLGLPCAKVARKFGLSRQRVWQIWQRYKKLVSRKEV